MLPYFNCFLSVFLLGGGRLVGLHYQAGTRPRLSRCVLWELGLGGGKGSPVPYPKVSPLGIEPNLKVGMCNPGLDQG